MSADEMGVLLLEIECRRQPAPWAMAQCIAVMAGALAMAGASLWWVPQNPPATVVPMPIEAVLAVLLLFSGGLFAFGAWGLWLEMRLAGLRVALHERGLA